MRRGLNSSAGECFIRVTGSMGALIRPQGKASLADARSPRKPIGRNAGFQGSGGVREHRTGGQGTPRSLDSWTNGSPEVGIQLVANHRPQSLRSIVSAIFRPRPR